MIEPTDEMVQAFGRVWRERFQFGSASQAEAARAGLAAVLTIVERDYDVRPKPKGWLIEHVDHHEDAPVEECTFCAPVPRASDEHHYDVPCGDRPYCRIHEHHEGGVLP